MPRSRPSNDRFTALRIARGLESDRLRSAEDPGDAASALLLAACAVLLASWAFALAISLLPA